MKGLASIHSPKLIVIIWIRHRWASSKIGKISNLWSLISRLLIFLTSSNSMRLLRTSFMLRSSFRIVQVAVLQRTILSVPSLSSATNAAISMMSRTINTISIQIGTFREPQWRVADRTTIKSLLVPSKNLRITKKNLRPSNLIEMMRTHLRLTSTVSQRIITKNSWISKEKISSTKVAWWWSAEIPLEIIILPHKVRIKTNSNLIIYNSVGLLSKMKMINRILLSRRDLVQDLTRGTV